ncbi:MAG: APC family permease [Nocardioidaceae bacterium]|nr:APC family permease [Nocardioidaceae bacterium]
MSDRTMTGESPGSGQTEELARPITGRLLFFYVLGDVLGSGIYALIGVMAFTVGGAFWLSFVVGVMIALMTGFAYAELITKYPQAAGASLYVHKAFDHRPTTFITTFCLLAATIAAAGTLARVFGGSYFEQFVSGVPTSVVAVAFIVVLSLVNFRGISESVWANMVMTVIETIGLGLVLLVGVVVIVNGDADFAPILQFEGNPVLGVLSGAVLAFFAMTGFENAANVAEETKNPSQVFPKALIGGMALAGVLYVVIALIAAMVAPIDELAADGGAAGSLLTVVQNGPIPVPDQVFSAIALVAVTNTALVSLVAQSRIMYGMARQGVMPRVFARVHPGRRTPWVAIVFTASLVVLLLLSADVDRLATVTVVFLIAVYGMVCASALKLRAASVEHEHYTAPTVLLWIGVVGNAGLLVYTAVDDPGALVWCAGMLAVGVVLYFVNDRFTDGDPPPVDDPAVHA